MSVVACVLSGLVLAAGGALLVVCDPIAAFIWSFLLCPSLGTALATLLVALAIHRWGDGKHPGWTGALLSAGLIAVVAVNAIIIVLAW